MSSFIDFDALPNRAFCASSFKVRMVRTNLTSLPILLSLHSLQAGYSSWYQHPFLFGSMSHSTRLGGAGMCDLSMMRTFLANGKLACTCSFQPRSFFQC